MLLATRVQVRQTVNTAMVQTYGKQQIKHVPLAKAKDFFRDPYVLGFLGAPAVPALYEKDLEQGLLDQLQTFLLELGKGFAFVARQKHLRVEGEDCFIASAQMRPNQPRQLKHPHSIFAEHGFEFGVALDGAFVFGVLQAVGFDVVPQLFHHLGASHRL